MLIRGAVLCAVVLLACAGCGDDKGGSVDLGPAGKLYVLNQRDGTLFIYDTRTLARLDSIDTRVKLPHYVAFSPDGAHYYITTLETSGHIAKFDAATNAFVDSVSVAPAVQPSAIAITSDSRYGYICNFTPVDQSNPVYKYDLMAPMTLSREVLAGKRSHDLTITADGAIMIVTNQRSDDLTLIDPEADSVLDRVSIDPDVPFRETFYYGPMGVVIDSRDSLAYVACMNARQVRVFDIAARMIVDSVAIPSAGPGNVAGPTLLAITPDDGTVFVTTQAANSIVAINTATMQVVADIPVAAKSPFGIAVSDDGSRVYVACVGETSGHGRVYVIDARNYTKVDSIDVGVESFGLAWRPAPE